MNLTSSPSTYPLSVIVPARNAEQTLESCLSSLRHSTGVEFELIVVDDGSTDRTTEIAERWADVVICLRQSIGPQRARRVGARRARSATWAFVDSDVMVQPSMLASVVSMLESDPTVDAVTARLSSESHDSGFFSRYKNLYMNFIFSRLPRRVTFLYGSFFALRKKSWRPVPVVVRGEDTALGQSLFLRGKNILLHQGEELIHLKRYTCLSFLRNDFEVPRAWARLFVRFQGWKQLGRHGTGYAHASKTQLCSVVIAPATAILAALHPILATAPFAVPCLIIWALLNFRMINFMMKMTGPFFGSCALVVTFVDNITMAFGIASGLVTEIRSSFPARSPVDYAQVSDALS